MKYVAFLRGINVGKHRRISMAELKHAFEAAGYGEVSTYIASGNVIFNAVGEDVETLTAEAEVKLESALGYHLDVIMRSADALSGLVAANPFAEVQRTDQIRLNVTFLGDPPKDDQPAPQVPGFRIVHVAGRAVCSVLDLGEIGMTDVMTMLEKTFGKRITTRSWKVIQEINSRYL